VTHSALSGVATSYDGSLALTVDDAGVARVWALPDGRCVARLSGHGAAATDVAMTPCGKTAATAGRDGRIRVWSIEWELGSAEPITAIPNEVRELLRGARSEGGAPGDARRELSWAGYGSASEAALAEALGAL